MFVSSLKLCTYVHNRWLCRLDISEECFLLYFWECWNCLRVNLHYFSVCLCKYYNTSFAVQVDVYSLRIRTEPSLKFWLLWVKLSFRSNIWSLFVRNWDWSQALLLSGIMCFGSHFWNEGHNSTFKQHTCIWV